LCGKDKYSGQCYEHRRDWLENQLILVADTFAIKVCAYAIMNNHYHVVLNVRTALAQDWSDAEVVERWHRLFNGTAISIKFLRGKGLSKVEETTLKPLILLWRERLTSISWLMRVVNERIARRANAEDDCTGSFWEGRFKSQALLDEKALLACMTYVDLNPLRSSKAHTPKQSDYTCIKKRIAAVLKTDLLPDCIERFNGDDPSEIGIPYTLKDYIDLVEWTGRIIQSKKSGLIQANEPAILKQLSIRADAWSILTTQFEQRFSAWVGSEQIVQSIYKQYKYQRKPSTSNHRVFFS
jgi:REP element-mobilizing transposase RayT